jgi:aminoglycoside phosphotransferase family enzyme
MDSTSAATSSSSASGDATVMVCNMAEVIKSPKTFEDFVQDPPEKAEVMETHLSRVCLLGEFAFKVKKAVNLGPPFADQSLLSERKRLCDEEYEKNKGANYKL